MQVSLDPELEEQLQNKVTSGEFVSTDAVLNAAVRCFLESYQDLNDPLPIEDMRREIMKGVEQSDRGELAPFDADAIIAKGRLLLAERQARK